MREPTLLPVAARFACLAILLSFLGISCATAPARLKHSKVAGASSGPLDEASLYDLITGACAAADSEVPCPHLAHFVSKWKEEFPQADSGLIQPQAEGDPEIRVKFVTESKGAFVPSYFDEISPAKDYEVKGLPARDREGTGAPLLAVRENRQIDKVEAYYPPEAISRAITAVVRADERLSDILRVVEIELLNTLQQDTIVRNGKTLPLAADYTVSWAGVLSRAKKLKSLAIWDTLRREPKRDPQLYLMEPYDPIKEPLIMIHGLFDTSLAWASLTNELWGEEAIRHRYQIWHYHYNTSVPALYAGRILREKLRGLRPMLDPEGDDPAMQSTTVIGRSMGGIVARSLVTDPGTAFWDAAFTKPIKELKLSEADRTALIDAFMWEPERHVKRVIFVTVPHRGSDFADTPLGKLGRTIVAPPNRFREFYQRVSKANPGAFTEAYQSLGKGRLDAVHALSPEQPTLKILSELPMIEPLKVHSLIGDRGKPGPLRQSHDGMVPYWSSHLESADSEVVLPHGHRLHEFPDAVAEIKKRLLGG